MNNFMAQPVQEKQLSQIKNVPQKIRRNLLLAPSSLHSIPGLEKLHKSLLVAKQAQVKWGKALRLTEDEAETTYAAIGGRNEEIFQDVLRCIRIKNWKVQRKLAFRNVISTNENLIRVLAVGVKNFSHLRAIEFDFRQTRRVTDQILEFLFSLAFSNLLNLKKLSLHIHMPYAWTNKSIRTLGYFLGQYMKNLRHLSLLIEGPNHTNKKGFEIFGHQTARYLFNLESLELCMGKHSKETSEYVEYIECVILAFRFDRLKLKTLSLKLLYFNLEDSHLNNLLNRVSESMPTLQHLWISSECEWGSNKIEGSGFQLKGDLPFLKKLSLILNQRCPSFHDSGLQKIIMEISNHYKSLKHLSLFFKECSQITDSGVETFGDAVVKLLPNLEHLELCFRSCRRINEETKMKLYQTLDFIPKLSIC